jgi:hypothetical protein
MRHRQSPYTDRVTIRSYARNVHSMPLHPDPRIRGIQLATIADMVRRGELVHTPSRGPSGPDVVLRALPGRDVGLRLGR